MQKITYDIVIFLVVAVILVIAMTGFIVSILYLYRRRQLHYESSLEKIKLDQEKIILNAQLEIQEQTFHHISREIHDNINLSLTLAKLNLNTIEWSSERSSMVKINSSIELLSQSIGELSDISKSLNADNILQHGLLRAITDEIRKIRETGLFALYFKINGAPIYMEAQKELIVFRIIQEAFNNIIKHAAASITGLTLIFSDDDLQIIINDNGHGFDQSKETTNNEAGIRNMENRIKVLNGNMSLLSVPGEGTMLSFLIPI
jgi:two-component system NarL family sensor kinase